MDVEGKDTKVKRDWEVEGQSVCGEKEQLCVPSLVCCIYYVDSSFFLSVLLPSDPIYSEALCFLSAGGKHGHTI